LASIVAAIRIDGSTARDDSRAEDRQGRLVVYQLLASIRIQDLTLQLTPAFVAPLRI
jgi:hypothetical protein